MLVPLLSMNYIIILYFLSFGGDSFHYPMVIEEDNYWQSSYVDTKFCCLELET